MATASLQGAVKEALVGLFTDALAGRDVGVQRGHDIEGDMRNVLRVGTDDPMSNSPGSASRSEVQFASFGAGGNARNREERGSVSCWLLVDNGDADSAGAETEAYRFLDLCQGAIQDSGWTLGLGGSGGVTQAWIGSVETYVEQDGEGAVCMVVFAVEFYGYINT